MKLRIMAIFMLLASTASLACASQEDTSIRGPKLLSNKITCDTLQVIVLSEKYPDGKSNMMVDVVSNVGNSVQVTNVTKRIEALIKTNEGKMKPTLRCNESTGLPELIIPTDVEAGSKVLTIDNAERVSLRLEPNVKDK